MNFRIEYCAAILMACGVVFGAATQSMAQTSGEVSGPILSPADEQNISGVWWTRSYSPEIQLIDGRELPLNEEGRALHAENRAALEADPLSDEARKFCTPDGVPRILASPYPFEILQTPEYVTIIYELNRVVRRIALDTPMPDETTLLYFPYFSGHSVGHWEGDTLIVETAGYNDKTFIDASGVPHSTQLHTVERMRKLDDGSLEVEITSTDPANFTAPFTARYVYDFYEDLRLEDYICGKPHRDISHIEGVNTPGQQ
jgi:hypothetical protein